jgi:tRNA-Thr(GGU) m(6)t(6)A37 methyltransferase TsaA
VGILDEARATPEFILDEIAVVRSNFPHRAGTPRQGTLAPHARSHLVLHPSIAPGALEGLENFSHLWIIFRFHINVDSEKKTKKAHKTPADGGQGGTKYSAKVKPPRAGGKKVGVFSTRTPHRPNPIGLSLCEIESIDLKNKTISVLGLDLVDFTPVYDIKPYIPWDSVHYSPMTKMNIQSNSGGGGGGSKEEMLSNLLSTPKVPEWVTDDEKIEVVKWSEEAKTSVKEARLKGILSPLFPPPNKKDIQKKKKKNKAEILLPPEPLTTSAATEGGKEGGADDNDGETLCEVCQAISEVIAQDPRAIHHGRGTTTEGQEDYSMTFNTLRVYFQILELEPSSSSSSSSSTTTCKTWAYVTSVMEDPGDITAPEGSYQHSVAMRKEAEVVAKARGMKTPLPWKYPVREGFVKDLFELRTGEMFSFDMELSPIKVYP